MMGRLMLIGIIALIAVWSIGIAVSAEDLSPTPMVTGSEIIITDDIEPYFGPMGPDSPLFGLKVALENLDEAFTFDQSEKVMKEMTHAELRIAEIKGLLLMNKSAEAERALDGYFEKLNLTSLDLARIPVRTTGVAAAYRQHVKHQLVLYDLIQANPNSPKLWRAYNHTLSLENRFMEKSTERIEKRTQQANRITVKVVRLQGQVQGTTTATPTAPITSDNGKGKEKKGEKITGTTPVTTETTPPATDMGSGRDKEKGNSGKGPK